MVFPQMSYKLSYPLQSYNTLYQEHAVTYRETKFSGDGKVTGDCTG